MGKIGRCKRNKGEKINCKCKRSNHNCNISQVEEIRNDVISGENIKKKIYKIKRRYDRKAKGQLIID